MPPRVENLLRKPRPIARPSVLTASSPVSCLIVDRGMLLETRQLRCPGRNRFRDTRAQPCRTSARVFGPLAARRPFKLQVLSKEPATHRLMLLSDNLQRSTPLGGYKHARGGEDTVQDVAGAAAWTAPIARCKRRTARPAVQSRRPPWGSTSSTDRYTRRRKTTRSNRSTTGPAIRPWAASRRSAERPARKAESDRSAR